MKRVKKYLSVAAVMCMLVSFTSCSSPKERVQVTDDDAQAQNSQEGDFITPDLAFFNLQGHVKSVTYNDGYSIPLLNEDNAPTEFDQDGVCTNIKSVLYTKEVAPKIELAWNEQGEIIKATYPERVPSAEAPGSYEFGWTDGKLFRITYEAWEDHEQYTISYNNGLISSIVFAMQTDGGNGETTVSLSDFKFDSNGNWTECKAAFETKEFDNVAVGEDPQILHRETDTQTLTRTITYY